ncbi:OmpA family protein [Cellulomonas flavigena]|uniref:OmpA family protein n=1 Tax=Cellulomonas flavigena TaxID=1711 RepID=UPI00315CF527
MGEREPGTVLVVGHTDDQGDDAYNRDLSLRRARAVADALAGLVDPARYPADVEGRGESEPFVANDSEENRALNRRVTLTLVSSGRDAHDLTTMGELPPFERGVVAEAGAPVRIVSGLRPWDVEASARRVAGHVVVDLRVTARDDASHLTSVAFLTSLFGHRGDGARNPHSTSNNATALSGATRLYALDYRVDHETAEAGLWLPVADLWGGASLDDGQSAVFSYVFPRLDGDTVTLQFGSGRGEDDLRIVDVPVVD